MVMDKKMKLIERLVKDGSIDLSEALMLLEKDTVVLTGNPIDPNILTKPYGPIQPYSPIQPTPFRKTNTGIPDWCNNPMITSETITYGAKLTGNSTSYILDDSIGIRNFTN